MSDTHAETQLPRPFLRRVGKRSLEPWMAAMHADWHRRWPAVFTTPVPLAVGFSGHMRAVLREENPDFDRNLFGLAIRAWTRQGAYLRAVMRGEMRRNLDGSDAGMPDDAARQEAKAMLDERAARRQAREQRDREIKQSHGRVAEAENQML